MTTPDDDLTMRIAEALRVHAMPLVEKYGDQRAAEELEAAANWGDGLTGIPQWQRHLRARAAALREQARP